MSFCRDFKVEILNNASFENDDQRRAFVSGVLRQIGSIHICKNMVNIEVESELEELILCLAAQLKQLYNIELTIKISKNDSQKRNLYTLQLPGQATKTIAADTGLILYSGDVAVGFNEDVYFDSDTDDVVKSYLLGLVASSAYITVPVQSKQDADVYEGGYSLEMRFSGEQLAYSVMNYFAERDIFLKKVERGEAYCLYMRDSEMISDFMAFFGGSNAVIAINDILVARSVRNDINRAQNCVIANIDKTIEAGQKQYMAIKLIEEKMTLEKLPPKLREIAEIRLENPDYTLDQIAAMTSDKISKSGINHRFRKIMEIAKTLQN